MVFCSEHSRVRWKEGFLCDGGFEVGSSKVACCADLGEDYEEHRVGLLHERTESSEQTHSFEGGLGTGRRVNLSNMLPCLEVISTEMPRSGVSRGQLLRFSPVGLPRFAEGIRLYECGLGWIWIGFNHMWQSVRVCALIAGIKDY